jgi:hypothetical protein
MILAVKHGVLPPSNPVIGRREDHQGGAFIPWTRSFLEINLEVPSLLDSLSVRRVVSAKIKSRVRE